MSFPARAAAQQRFPRPDFQSDYLAPTLTLPGPRTQWLEYQDVGLLVVALALAAYFALRRRSRRGLLLVTLFSLAYFGFWRRGCICAVGSVQNLALGFGDAAYAVPLTVIAFFALPLLAALFFGRVFCAAVCPLGAVQELVVWRPLRLPLWLNHVLGLIPWIYLAVAVLYAATGTGFPICRWDPFVGFFRLGAPWHMLALGVAILAVGVFVGRPYCRFLCPYGALLGVMSRFSRRHVTITPDRCIQCRLCEEACPYDAIRKPLSAAAPESLRQGVRRLALILMLAPIVALSATGVGYLFGRHLSQANDRVALALEVFHYADEDTIEMSLEREAFFTSGLPTEALYADARAIQRQFAAGGMALGALLALMGCVKLLGLSLWRSRKDFEPDRAQCVSCARCFEYCPVERNPVKPVRTETRRP